VQQASRIGSADGRAAIGSHYFPAVLAEQFDAYVWFEETRAVTPVPARHQQGVPETYPFGL
jgi:erythromycin esterase-like protein